MILLRKMIWKIMHLQYWRAENNTCILQKSDCKVNLFFHRGQWFRTEFATVVLWYICVWACRTNIFTLQLSRKITCLNSRTRTKSFLHLMLYWPEHPYGLVNYLCYTWIKTGQFSCICSSRHRLLNRSGECFGNADDKRRDLDGSLDSKIACCSPLRRKEPLIFRTPIFSFPHFCAKVKEAVFLLWSP